MQSCTSLRSSLAAPIVMCLAALAALGAPDGEDGPRDGADLIEPERAPRSVELRVLADGEPVAGADATLVLSGGVFRSQSSDATGAVRFEGVPEGTWLVAVREGNWNRVGLGRAVVPRLLTGPLVVNLAAPRALEIQVVEEGTGLPLPGIVFDTSVPHEGSIGPLPPMAPTDSEGRTLIRGAPSRETLLLCNFHGPNYYSPDGILQSFRAEPDLQNLRVELQPTRTCRFPLAEGDGLRPADGTVVSLQPHPGKSWNLGMTPPTGRVEGEFLVIEGVAFEYGFDALAELEDGRQSFVQFDNLSGPREVRFLVPKELVVHSLDKEYNSVPGVAFALQGPGGATHYGQLVPAVVSDASGRAVFRGPFRGEVTVFELRDPRSACIRCSCHRGNGGHQREAGTIHLDSGEREVRCVAKTACHVEVRVIAEGQRTLPEGWKLGGIPGPPEFADPAKGEIRFSYRPWFDGEELEISIHAPGFLPASAVVGEPVPGTPGVVELHLQRGEVSRPGRILFRVLAPADGERSLALQRRSGGTEEWESIRDEGGSPLTDADGAAVLEPLDPGTYRILDSPSGLATEPIDMTPGHTSKVVMDLSNAHWVEGEVTCPDGLYAGRTRIHMEGGDIHQWTEDVGDDGAFRLRHPGDRRLLVRATHPLWVSAPDAPAMLLESSDDTVRLRLAAGPRACLKVVPTPDRLGFDGYPGTQIRISLHGEDLAAPAAFEWERPVVDHEVVLFGGFRPGRWSVWIDVDGFTPKLLRDVELRDGHADLGVFHPVVGGSLRIDPGIGGHVALAGVWVEVSSLNVPRYVRQEYLELHEGETTLGGLAEGSFHVRVKHGFSENTLFEKDIVSDGEGEVVVVLPAPDGSEGEGR